MKVIWRRVLILAALVVIFEAILLYVISTARADEEPVVTIEFVATPSPTPMPVPTAAPTPTPTVTPELPEYDYPAEDTRCLSRGIWSVCPASPTYNTKLAFCELVQNREDDTSGDFSDGIRWILLQGNEFPSYDPDAYRSHTNNEVADHAMRTWIYATVTGDRSYRLVPVDGLYCDFYRAGGWDYIKIYNRAGDVVYDSGVPSP